MDSLRKLFDDFKPSFSPGGKFEKWSVIYEVVENFFYSSGRRTFGLVHIRDASDDSRNILVNYNAQEVGGVLHCFNASEHLLCLSEHNFYFGIGGVVTFKNAKKLPKIS